MEDPKLCSICFERFTEPIILKCGHSFDRSCIKDLTTCPLCRKHITAWTTNWQLIHLLEYHPNDDITSDPFRYYQTTTYNNLKMGQRVTIELNDDELRYYGRVGRITDQKMELHLTQRKILVLLPEQINQIWYHPGFGEFSLEENSNGPSCCLF